MYWKTRPPEANFEVHGGRIFQIFPTRGSVLTILRKLVPKTSKAVSQVWSSLDLDWSPSWTSWGSARKFSKLPHVVTTFAKMYIFRHPGKTKVLSLTDVSSLYYRSIVCLGTWLAVITSIIQQTALSHVHNIWISKYSQTNKWCQLIQDIRA